jgi:hypothetical protein
MPPAPTQPAPPQSLADEVGLQIGPNPNSIHDDIQKMLQEVALPEEREPANFPGVPAFVAPAAPPVGPVMPQLAPELDPIANQEVVAPAPQKPRDIVVSLHTMKDDLQDAVKAQQLSVVKVVALESDKRAKLAPKNETLPEVALPKRPSAPRNRRALLLVAMIIVFIALGAAALFAAFIVTQKQGGIPVTQNGILFAEQQTILPLGTQGIGGVKASLSNMLSSQTGGAGSVLQITPVILGSTGQPQRKATFEEFLRAIGARPPDDLLRSVSGDFFLGIHAADRPSPVFIIPVTSYDHAFAAMLAWESALDQDFAPLFKQVSPYITTSASSTPQNRPFQDAVMRNYDVRVLRDNDGSVVLYYSFPSPSILIIASSPYTFPEVLSRLQAGRKL